MTGLLWSEIRRIASRRLVKIAVLLVLLGIVAGGAWRFLDSSRDVSGNRAQAQRQAEDCRRNFEEGEFAPPADLDLEEICDPENFLFDPRFHFAEGAIPTTRGVAMVLLVVSFVCGVSIAGAEWGSGYVSTILSWEPRRGRVHLAKVSGVALALGVFAAVALAFLSVIQYPAAAFRGSTEGTDAETWRTLAGIWLRGGAVSALWGAAGAALATLTRNSAAAMGIGLAYGGIVDQILTAWKPWLAPWLLQRNLLHAMGFDVPVAREVQGPGGGTMTTFVTSEAPALWQTYGRLGLYIAGIALIAYAVFRARDVT